MKSEEKMAEITLDPAVNGAAVVRSYDAKFGPQNVADLMVELHAKIQQLHDGDMGSVEAMLFSQAAALQAIFVDLATRARTQTHMPLMQAQLSMAMKAQAQCRATLEALAEVKNPRRTTFVQQQNIASQQQVNNGGGSASGVTDISPAKEKILNSSNELLEVQDDERLDSRAPCTTIDNDPVLETVGKIDRPPNGRRKTA